MPKSSLGTTVYGPDSSLVDSIGNLAAIFSPENQAKAALQKAHSEYYGSAAELEKAKAIAAQDQNNALSESVLLAAGYNPMVAAGMRASRPNSLADIMRGVNMNNGGTMITSGQDPRAALALLGQGAAASDPNFAFSDEAANAVAARNNSLATQKALAVQAATPHNVGMGQTAYTVSPDGTPNVLIQAPMNVAPGHTIVQPNGAGVSQLFQSPVKTGTDDPVKAAQSELKLYDNLYNSVVADVSPVDSTGKAYKYTPPADQTRSIADYAMELIKKGTPPNQAKILSAQAHGVPLNPASLQQTASHWFGPNEYSLQGFHPPVANQPQVAPQAAPAVQPQATPTPVSANVIRPSTQAEIDNAPSGSIIEVNGKRFRKP